MNLMKIALLVLAGFAAGVFVTYSLTQVQEARADANRVYELRTYHTLPGRLPPTHLAPQYLATQHLAPKVLAPKILALNRQQG